MLRAAVFFTFTYFCSSLDEAQDAEAWKGGNINQNDNQIIKDDQRMCKITWLP